jgi:hypothetical protein
MSSIRWNFLWIVLTGLQLVTALVSAEIYPEQDYASYTFGHLGGPRDIIGDKRYVYWLSSGKLRIAKKDTVIKFEPKVPPATEQNPKPKPEPFTFVSELDLKHAVETESGGKKVTQRRGLPDRICFISSKMLCASTGLHLRLIDIRNQKKPKIVDTLRLAKNTYRGVSSIRSNGKGSVWAACRRGGLVRLKIDSDKMSVVSRTPVNGWASDVLLAGNHAFVATWRGLEVFDVSGTEPRRLAELDTYRHCEYLALSGNTLFFTSKYYLVAIDISDVANPKILSEIGTIDPFFYSGAVSLKAIGEHIYCSHTEGGVYVWHFDRPSKQFKLLIQTSYWGNRKKAPSRKEKAEMVKKKMEELTGLGMAEKHAKAAAADAWQATSYLIAVGLHVDTKRKCLFVNPYDWGKTAGSHVHVYSYDLNVPKAQLVNWTE